VVIGSLDSVQIVVPSPKQPNQRAALLRETKETIALFLAHSIVLNPEEALGFRSFKKKNVTIFPHQSRRGGKQPGRGNAPLGAFEVKWR